MLTTPQVAVNFTVDKAMGQWRRLPAARMALQKTD